MKRTLIVLSCLVFLGGCGGSSDSKPAAEGTGVQHEPGNQNPETPEQPAGTKLSVDGSDRDLIYNAVDNALWIEEYPTQLKIDAEVQLRGANVAIFPGSNLRERCANAYGKYGALDDDQYEPMTRFEMGTLEIRSLPIAQVPLTRKIDEVTGGAPLLLQNPLKIDSVAVRLERDREKISYLASWEILGKTQTNIEDALKSRIQVLEGGGSVHVSMIGFAFPCDIGSSAVGIVIEIKGSYRTRSGGTVPYFGTVSVTPKSG